jgi:RimJ/RimL family protein N-acetyltransferase
MSDAEVAQPKSPTEPVRVEGEGISLRPFTADDIEPVGRAYAEPDIIQWTLTPVTNRDWDAWLDHRMNWTDQTHASWAIADADDAFVGSISLHNLEYELGQGEMGYWIAPWARRQGFAAGALQLAVGFGFEVVHLHRIELFHAVENPASCGVAVKAGFRHEGTLVESYRYGDGKWYDEHLHGILAREWLGSLDHRPV